MGKTGVVILAHGSRGERGSVEVPKALRRVTDGVKFLLSPGVEVIGAALQFNQPNLEEAVKYLVDRGAAKILVMPYFLFPGRHITEQIPHLVDGFKRTYPGRQFIMASPLGLDRLFIAQAAECILEAAPELSPDGRPSISPSHIEQQSMEIIEKLLPSLPMISEEELAVVKRVVHSAGDPEVANLIRFGPSAISNGLDAISNRSPIFTDVRMVAAGINKDLAKVCGCALSCALDDMEPLERPDEESLTRTASAMRSLGKKLNHAVIAIGNSPTALLAILDLIDRGEIEPALVVGMPVGFVQARESKDELMKRSIPYITVAGTRGGSPLAAAAVNSLLKMAVKGNTTYSAESHP